MGGVFISYRRGDAAGVAGRLFDRLEAKLGRDQVFMDVDSIEPGVDFVDTLDRHLIGCDVLLAIIGPNWLTMVDQDGCRRIDSEADFVRLEVGVALKRGIRVVPILVDGARPPLASDVPENLRPLTRRQAIEIRHERFRADVEQLLTAIAAAPQERLTEFSSAVTCGPVGTWRGQVRFPEELLQRTWILHPDGRAESTRNEFGVVDKGSWTADGADVVLTFTSGTIYQGKISADIFSGSSNSASDVRGVFEMKYALSHR